MQRSAQSTSHSGLTPAAYTESFVEVAGLRLRIQDYGTSGKPPMLCLHGGAANAHWYDFVAKGFTPDYHMRAVDLRGHGDSDWDESGDYTYRRQAQDVHELAEKLALEDFILIGHSMGGMISSVYAATYPGRARAVVVVDSNLVMTHERIANYNVVGNREAREYATQEEFIANYRVRPSGSMAAPEILRHIAHHSGRRFDDGRWRHKVDRKVYVSREMVDGFGQWDHIKIPALLIKAEHGARVTPQVIAELQSRAPQLQVATVPGADHHVTLDNPAGFIRVVREFLAKL